MCDDDNIDDVLEKVTINDALQELFQNQEKPRVAEKSSCTRTSEKKEAFEIFAVLSRPSSSGSMPLLSQEDSSALNLVSCTLTPLITSPSSQKMSPPSLNHPNSTGTEQHPRFLGVLST